MDTIGEFDVQFLNFQEMSFLSFGNINSSSCAVSR
jgi:hypothetical protein